MQTIFIMVKCDLAQAYEVADRVIQHDRISEVYTISGTYDLMLKCYLDDGVDVGHFVTEQIQTVAGVKDTNTIMAFKAFN